MVAWSSATSLDLANLNKHVNILQTTLYLLLMYVTTLHLYFLQVSHKKWVFLEYKRMPFSVQILRVKNYSQQSGKNNPILPNPI